MVGLSIYLGTDTERDVRNLCLVHRKRIGLIACAQSRAGFHSRMKDSARSYQVRSIGGTFVRLRFPAKRQFTEALGSTHTRQFLRKFEDAKTHAIPIAWIAKWMLRVMEGVKRNENTLVAEVDLQRQILDAPPVQLSLENPGSVTGLFIETSYSFFFILTCFK